VPVRQGAVGARAVSACVERMGEREFWRIVHSALTMILKAIERRYLTD